MLEEYYRPFNLPDFPKEDWDTYRGSNHNEFVGYKYPAATGGTISIGKILGQPLDAKLWETLVLRWKPRGLWIVGHRESQWTIIPMSPGIILYLDENKLVSNIHLTPTRFDTTIPF